MRNWSEYYGMFSTQGNRRVHRIVLECLYNDYTYENAFWFLGEISKYKTYSEAYDTMVRDCVYEAMQPGSEQYKFIKRFKLQEELEEKLAKKEDYKKKVQKV